MLSVTPVYKSILVFQKSDLSTIKMRFRYHCKCFERSSNLLHFCALGLTPIQVLECCAKLVRPVMDTFHPSHQDH